MLEIRNLNKTYISKESQQVKAIDHTNLKFGDSGLIFIVGDYVKIGLNQEKPYK